MTSALYNIDHIIVLMLENRSFDSMLGRLYPPSPGFDGLTGKEVNKGEAGSDIAVWNSPGTDNVTMTIPDPDPGELWSDINAQLFGDKATSPWPAASMSGFALNYLAQGAAAGKQYDARKVMHYFKPDQVPVLSKLARQFAVCDRWFASAPCQTWPNRFFIHTGTALGYENNSPPHFPYTMETIFNRFELAGDIDWRIYFHDIAQSKTLSKLWLLAEKFRFFEEFKKDAALGELPAYSFIEPRYFADFAMPNDQHPPHNVTLGEQLIADVYNSLRNGKAWTKTLLIITYDEHGGCFDHVSPPSAVPPSTIATAPFNFDRYGVRVPAVLVSPYIQQSTVLRPPGDAPYDHTSVIATLRARFPQLGPPLTDRDSGAPNVGNALTLAGPTNMGPDWIEALPYAASPTAVANTHSSPLNGMQEGLVSLAANLPTAAVGVGKVAVPEHVAAVRLQNYEPPPEALENVQKASAYVRQELGRFFRPV